MRILNLLSGVAVLFTTLAFVHLVHQFWMDAPDDNPVVWAGSALAVVVGILSLLGACLQLRPGQ